jgi:MoxR-like ATPase
VTSATRTAPAQRPQRIYIVGGAGTGKTTFARRVAGRRDLPTFHLDELVLDAAGALRPLDERNDVVARVASEPAWIVEGIYLGWTEPLLERADVIVWLDYVSPVGAVRRVVARFARGALEEARRQRGLRRFLRFSDYLVQLRRLAAFLVETLAYHLLPSGARHPGASEGEAASSRRAARDSLLPYREKVLRCRRAEDVRAALDAVS